MFHLTLEVREKLRRICDAISNSREAPWWMDHFDAAFPKWSQERAFNKMVRALEHDLGQLGMDFAGARVLDAGCGSSLICTVMGLVGATEVQGIDVWDAGIAFAEGYLRDICNGELPVRISKQDAAALRFPDSYFDVVICREAISHFQDPYGFLAEASRVLKPGGKLFISDGNNGANPRIRRKTYAIWEHIEIGPTGPFHGHMIDETMQQKRRRLLADRFADLSASELDALAVHTFGMSASQTLQAAETYRATGEMPDSLYQFGKCPTEPETGMLLEALFHPYELAGDLRKYGFEARVYAYFSHGRHPALAAISRALAKVSRISIVAAPTFQIIATKR